MAGTTAVTTANFDEVVLKSTTPVLVDFWAEWCGPCRAVGPILEEISNEHGDKIKIVKLNTDEESAIAIKYGITSIPTIAGTKYLALIGYGINKKIMVLRMARRF